MLKEKSLHWQARKEVALKQHGKTFDHSMGSLSLHATGGKKVTGQWWWKE